MDKNYVVGIDLGGTKISGALADLQGNVLSQFTMPTDAHEGEQAVLSRIIQVIEKVITDSGKTAEEVKAIGIGSPGPLDAKSGIIITTPNLPFKNFKLVEPIAEKFNIPTYLDNDANVAAIGEYMLGAGKGTTNMVYVTVSTGVGGGAILNGKIYRGSTSNALEVGHTTVLPNGPRCNCGNYGCVEALASGTAIGRQAKEAVESGLETSLKNYEKVTSYEVFKEAEKGDKVSKEILDRSLGYLGIGIANIISSFDPEMVVIGGGVSKGGQIVFDKVKEVVNERCFKAMAESCKIVPAALGTDAGVIGAVALALLESK
ncbi:ROK family protein [Clostridium sp. SYSU_GA19001]|uniref:ROK family protein n=1 Tax=Clostridium caldaquaticum TaxID=2940653 RepID=UPI002076D7FB|nr:ROK family protein [Clostridium caldaquaticum]MCM8711793.1 ROK family protein [Clostridium caldaquaticum]